MLIGVAFFCPNEVTNRTHSRGYVEDSRAQTGGERCTKMTVLSLSVLPLYGRSNILLMREKGEGLVSKSIGRKYVPRFSKGWPASRPARVRAE